MKSRERSINCMKFGNCTDYLIYFGYNCIKMLFKLLSNTILKCFWKQVWATDMTLKVREGWNIVARLQKNKNKKRIMIPLRNV